MEPFLPIAAASAVSVGVGVLLLVSCCRGNSEKKSAEPKSKKAKAAKQSETKEKEAKDDSKGKSKDKEPTKSKDAKDSSKTSKKPKKKAEKPVATGGRWAALAIEGESDDDAPSPKKSAPKQQQKGKGQQTQPQKQKAQAGPKKQQMADDDDDSDDQSPTSKSQRRRQNKKKANQDVSLKAGQTMDSDGFVSVVDPKKVRKAQKEKEAKAGGYSGSNNYVPGANYGSSAASNSAPADDGESAELIVDPKQFGVLIGPEAATLKKLQEGTQTNIEVPKKDSGSNKIIIRGSRENIQNAKSAISSLLTRGFSGVTHPGFTCSEITAVGPAVGIIVGPGGENIKALQQAFGVRVITPDRKTGSTKVIVSGPKDAVKKAKEAVKSLIQFGFSAATHPGYIMEELTFPRESFNLLIGPAGQTIKSIQGDTKTKINIPDQFNANQNLVIVGPENGVKRAITQINRLLTKEQQNIKQVKYARAKEEEEEEEIDDEARQYYWDGSNDNQPTEEEGIWG